MGRIPLGHRRADFVERLLGKDRLIFDSEFPVTPENVSAMIDELVNYEDCYAEESDSLNLDKVGEWISLRLTDFKGRSY